MKNWLFYFCLFYYYHLFIILIYFVVEKLERLVELGLKYDGMLEIIDHQISMEKREIDEGNNTHKQTQTQTKNTKHKTHR